MRNGDSTRTSTTDRCFHPARQHLFRSILHRPRFGPICIDRLQLPRDLSVIVPTVSIPEGDITMKTLLKTAMLTGACMIAAPALAQTTPADPAAPQQTDPSMQADPAMTPQAADPAQAPQTADVSDADEIGRAHA